MEDYIESKYKDSYTFFDYVDPCSGILLNSENPNCVYYEMGGIELYRTDVPTRQMGMCRVADHPKFGVNCYVASMFTDAPKEIL